MKEFKFNPVQRILVPTDFSSNAEHALGYAAFIAQKLKSRLILFHSIKVPIVVMNETVVVAKDEELLKDSDGKLATLRDKITSLQSGVEVETRSSVGFAVDEILNDSAHGKPDLIIMGTRGAHGLGEMLFGSNTAAVISRSECPVLAVPHDAKTGNMNKILFATNYSDNDFHSIFLLTEMFKPWNPQIIILHASEGTQPQIETEFFDRFKEELMSLVPYDRFAFSLVEGPSVDGVVSDYATQNNVDLISVSKRKRTLFERFVSVSTTRRLAYHAHIPLLVFPS